MGPVLIIPLLRTREVISSGFICRRIANLGPPWDTILQPRGGEGYGALKRTH